MQISKITIDNFRSIKHAEVTADKFNIFVGQNNHGKTNFFEAIDWFYGAKGNLDKIRFLRTGDAEVCVEIEFSEIQDGIAKMKNEKNRTAIKNLLGENDTVRVKRTSIEPRTRKIFDAVKNEWLAKNPTGFDSAFNDFLPKFEYVSTQINPMEIAKYGKNTPIANMLSGVLSTILEQNKEYASFQEQFNKLFTAPESEVRVRLDELSGKVKLYLEKQFPDCNKVVFEVAEPVFEDLLKNFDTSVDDGVYTDADEKGDGMQRALMLAIIQAYADFRREHEETSKYFLFFIDEGELHLHPSAQRKLKNALLELAKGGDQVFINTHSSVLVVDEHEEQTIFKVEKINKETNIIPINETEKPFIVYELLGGSPADLLLPKNFLIVEGKSDLEFVNKVIARHYPEKPRIQIVPAGGDIIQTERSFNAIVQVFKPLEASIYKDKAVIFVDKQLDVTQRDTFLMNHANLQINGQFFESTAGSIEEYYPATWQKIAADVKKMSGDDKLSQAKLAGDGILKDDFENQMPQLFQALIRCWNSAYN
ncbi:MAG: ATP-dependent nuclease [Patescibacteria group bacterium]